MINFMILIMVVAGSQKLGNEADTKIDLRFLGPQSYNEI